MNRIHGRHHFRQYILICVLDVGQWKQIKLGKSIANTPSMPVQNTIITPFVWCFIKYMVIFTSWKQCSLAYWKICRTAQYIKRHEGVFCAGRICTRFKSLSNVSIYNLCWMHLCWHMLGNSLCMAWLSDFVHMCFWRGNHAHEPGSMVLVTFLWNILLSCYSSYLPFTYQAGSPFQSLLVPCCYASFPFRVRVRVSIQDSDIVQSVY